MSIAKGIDISAYLPTKSSSSEDWISFYNVLKSKFGKESANYAFAMAWDKRGGSDSKADVNAVEKGTGMKLDKDFIASLESAGNSALGFLDIFPNTLKIGMYAGLGIAILLIGGLTIRLVTASSADLGTAAGTAAKAFA